MDPIRQQLMAEATRRFAGQQPSSAGIGASAANSSSPSNPLAARGVMAGQSNPPTGNPTMPTADNPNAGAISTMQKSKPGESEIIIKALSNRLKQLPV